MIRFEPLWWVLLFGVVIAPFLAGAAAAEKALPTSQAEIQLTYAPLVKEAAPAVVNIFSRRVVQTIRSPFFDDPFFAISSATSSLLAGSTSGSRTPSAPV